MATPNPTPSTDRVNATRAELQAHGARAALRTKGEPRTSWRGSGWPPTTTWA